MILDEIIEKTMENQQCLAILDEMFEKPWKINDYCSDYWKKRRKIIDFQRL